MLHVDRIVIRLRKATRDRLSDSEQAIEQAGTKEGIMNEIVPYPVDVRIDH